MESNILTPNRLTFIALANEFCEVIENVETLEKDEFVNKMLKLIPRLYITVSDIEIEDQENYYTIESQLEEEVYDIVRNTIAGITAEDDVYLEVFVDDMKYSDTPIACTISENIADLYQELYNFIAAVKASATEDIPCIIDLCKENFENYWAQTACNVLRALNAVKFNPQND